VNLVARRSALALAAESKARECAPAHHGDASSAPPTLAPCAGTAHRDTTRTRLMAHFASRFMAQKDKRRLGSAVLLGLSLLVVVPVPCSAQQAPTSTGGEYGRLVQEATQDFDAGDFAEAHALFERAHKLEPNARTLRGLGKSSFELQHYVQAIREFSDSLSETEKPLTPEQRADVAELLDRAKSYIATVILDVSPREAVILVDGEAVKDGTLTLDPGDRRVTVHADGYRDQDMLINAEGGETKTISIRLAPIGASAPLAAQGVALPQPSTSTIPAPAHALAPDKGPIGAERSQSLLAQWWFWTAVGVAIAGGVTAGVLLQSPGTKAPTPGVGGVVSVLRVQR
jgi:tetratricopeptide (TPR) repeat protein